MAEIEKKFLSGRMNKDVDKRLVADGEYLDAVNVSVNTTEGSTIGAAQNSLGNDLIGDISKVLEARGLNSIINPIVIGVLPFEAKNLIYWLVTSDNFDGIFEYNELTGDTILILGSTIGQLNFNRRHIVTGINYVYNPDGSLLFWTDGYNPPRRINIARCKTYNIDDPQINDDIDVVLRPPLSAPYIKLSNDSTANLRPNNLEQKFLYFSYRFKYVDNEYSSMSPYSAVAFQPKSFAIDVETGENKGMVNIFNQANITFETGNQFVKEIQLLVRDTSGLNVRIVDSFNKNELGISDNSSYEFTFMNNKTYAALPADQTTRLFDNVPLLASAQEIIGNRLIYGDYTQFRNIVSCDNEFINVNYKVDYVFTSIPSGTPVQTFRSDRDYEVGIVYGDDYGRITTVLTSNDSNSSNANTNAVYIPPANSSTANSLSVTINSPAPCWATNYRFFVKQAKSDYYNIFPITFIKDGNYRYFLINESDRDKIIVNGYIIFKTFDNGPTYSNKQFKVLELEYKKADFITGSNALEGLYFKIKAGPNDTFLYAPTQQTFNSDGSGRGPKPNLCGGDGTQPPVIARQAGVEGPIYYSALNDNTIQNTGPSVHSFSIVNTTATDARITIEVLPGGSTFHWTTDVSQNTWIADLAMSTSPILLNIPGGLGVISIVFDATSGYNVGDKFVFNVRGNGSNLGTPLQINGSRGLPNTYFNPTISEWVLIASTNDYGGHSILKGPGEIFPGAVISINILNDGPGNSAPGQNASSMSWTSTAYYKDIEEWFWQSGAYTTFVQYDQNNNNVNATAVTFRYGIDSTNQSLTIPSNSISQTTSGNKYMLIRGFGDNSNCSRNLIQASLKVTQTPSNKQLIAETVPKESDLDIFHELSHTYPVQDGKHIVLWHYDKSSAHPLGTKLTNTDHKFPHYYGVGDMVYVRSSNIPIGFYEVVFTFPNDQYTLVIDFAFPGTSQPGAIAFNNTDQDQGTTFNAAKVLINNTMFKNSDYNAFAYGNGLESYRILDDYNAPRMDYSLRASTIIEDYEEERKYASLTYSGLYRWDSSINRLNEFNLSTANFKNLDQSYGPVRKLFARDSDLLVLHQDKVTQVYYGKNLLVDAVGGSQVASVPEVLGTQIASQSEYGISDNPESFTVWSNNYYFADARRGAVLMMTGNDIVEISENGMRDYFIDFFSLSPNTQKLGGYDPHSQTYMISGNNILRNPCRTSITPGFRTLPSNTLGQSYLMFSLSSVTSWTVDLEDLGFGTNWIDIPPYCLSGSGSQDIYANVQNNLTGSPRKVKFVVRYCDQILEFILTQGQGKETDISLIAFNKEL